MKYIVLGFEGFIFSVSQHLQKEGCDVLTGQVVDGKKTSLTSRFSEDREEKKLRLSVYDNIVEKIPIDELIKKLEKIKDPKNYFVICESNTLFHYASYLQSLGFEGNFPTREDRQFELDRNLSKKFVEKQYPEIKVAENKSFDSIVTAISFLKKSSKVWVLKSQTDLLSTVVPKTDNTSVSSEQLIEQLTVNKGLYEQFGFLLEEKIPSVIEVTPEKMFYDGVPLGMTVMFENKGIGSGNISYQIGCAGDMVFPVSMKSKIHDICFPPIVDEIAKKHKGLFIWDASLLIDKKSGEIYFGEFCPNRFGFNSFLTTLEQQSSVHTFFETVVKKKNPFTEGAIGVSLMLFNLLQDPETSHILKDVQIDYPEKYAKHFWPYDMYKNTKNNNIQLCGYDTVICPVTATGKTFSKAVDNLYTYVDSFQMNNLYYRPKFDFVSREYESSLLNRLEYCLDRKLFNLPFAL